MERTKWTERVFSFNFPPGWLPNVLERLRGATPRLKNIVEGLSEDEMEIRYQGKWSIKEHIGHLGDLEDLHTGRIDDFIAGKEILRAADMSNIKTEHAGHNNQPVEKLIRIFAQKRDKFITRLELLDDQVQQCESLHPRLQQMMRPVDLAYFTAEHDDHHLASIRELLKFIPMQLSAASGKNDKEQIR